MDYSPRVHNRLKYLKCYKTFCLPKLPHTSLHMRTLLHQRITDTFMQAFEYHLAILQAGSGYRASTVRNAFAEVVNSIAWYQMTVEDNDPLVFLSHRAVQCQPCTGCDRQLHPDACDRTADRAT